MTGFITYLSLRVCRPHNLDLHPIMLVYITKAKNAIHSSEKTKFVQMFLTKQMVK